MSTFELTGEMARTLGNDLNGRLDEMEANTVSFRGDLDSHITVGGWQGPTATATLQTGNDLAMGWSQEIARFRPVAEGLIQFANYNDGVESEGAASIQAGSGQMIPAQTT